MFIELICSTIPSDEFYEDDLWFIKHAIKAESIVDIEEWTEHFTDGETGKTEKMEVECKITLSNGKEYLARYDYDELMKIVMKANNETLYCTMCGHVNQ